MNPVTHYTLSWLTASQFALNKKQRITVAVAGIIPDVDGIGIAAEFVSRHTSLELNWWSDYHHVMGHNVTLACIVAFIALKITRNVKCSVISFMVFHLHLLCDILGGRGPDSYQWPIDYLYPFSDSVQLSWSGQWMLNGWQNITITVASLLIIAIVIIKKNISPTEIFPEKIDQAVIKTIQNRFQKK